MFDDVVSNERIKFDDKLPFDAMLPVSEFIELALIMLPFMLFSVPFDTLAYLVSDCWLLVDLLASMANLFGVNGAVF